MASKSLFQRVVNFASFYCGPLDKSNVIKSASVEDAAWETTKKLRNQYMSTCVERFPARLAALREDMVAFRERLVHFARHRTLDPEKEIVPMAWIALELFIFYQVGRNLARRSIQFIAVKPYEKLPEH